MCWRRTLEKKSRPLTLVPALRKAWWVSRGLSLTTLMHDKKTVGPNVHNRRGGMKPSRGKINPAVDLIRLWRKLIGEYVKKMQDSEDEIEYLYTEIEGGR